MPIHIMLDLETWGTRPGCDIRSIGACVFVPETGLVHDGSLGTIKPFYIATRNPQGLHGSGKWRGKFTESVTGWERKYKLHRDRDTVKWWDEQSEEAQAAFYDPLDLKVALERFTPWITALDLQDVNNGNHGLRLWSHGPAFDPPILAEAYHAVKLPVPWHYRAPRDTRTLFDLAGIEDHSAYFDAHPGPLGIPHHALDDAICQARAVCAAWSVVKGM